MALRAGYVGVKRWIYEKLGKDVINLNISKMSYAAANILGAKNFTPGISTVSSRVTNNGSATHSVSEGVMNISTTTSSGSGVYYSSVRLAADYAALGSNAAIISYKYKGEAAFEGSFGTTAKAEYLPVTTDWQNRELYVEDMSNPPSIVMYSHDTTAAHTLSIKDFMVRPAIFTNNEYVPYSKTNQQLTGDITTLEGVDDAHKTVINGIISAATGAADFAAFKTAMAALTPLTRSAAPDTREASPEVIEDDPEPVTKTTKSSTKKTATTKEGE